MSGAKVLCLWGLRFADLMNHLLGYFVTARDKDCCHCVPLREILKNDVPGGVGRAGSDRALVNYDQPRGRLRESLPAS